MRTSKPAQFNSRIIAETLGTGLRKRGYLGKLNHKLLVCRSSRAIPPGIASVASDRSPSSITPTIKAR